MEGPSKQANSLEMQSSIQQKRTSYKRSHSLPTIKKGLYDSVLSEDLFCNHHECSSASSGRAHQKVAQALSFENRDLVKVEIEMELANSVPEELKMAECNDEEGGCSSQGVTGDLHVVTADVEISDSMSDSETSQWSLDFTPDLLADNIPIKRHIRRSNSWSYLTNISDPDQILIEDSFRSFDPNRHKRRIFPPRKKRCTDGSSDSSSGQRAYRSSCGTRMMRYRNVHATLSLHEQQIQALEQHLEQNAYVPVQLLIGSQQTPSNDLQRPLFALANIVTGDCSVCYDGSLVRLRECCQGLICDNCFKQYLTTMIDQRIVTIQCPMYECKKYVTREEIAHHVEQETRDKFYRFILEANCDSNTKTCPHCNSLKSVDKKLVAKKSWSSYEAKVICEECDFEWCFPCHAPWHDGMSCKEYWKGDRLLRDWAKERPQGIVNAHRCPKCRVFIQRSSGCDHMTCSRCGTEFCYQCGGRFRGIRYFGNHYSRFSIFGCKYRYKPEDPVERKVVRGAVFGLQLLVLPLVPCAAVLAGCALIVVIAPAFGVKSLREYNRRRKYRKKREKIAREDRELGAPWAFKRYQMTCNKMDVAYP